MKRLLFCLVALIAVMAMVVPSYAAEMKINGMNHIRAIARDNYDGDDDADDSSQYITQRFRMYFTSIASENLKLVYKTEIDYEYGDNNTTTYDTTSGGDSVTLASSRNDGGGIAGDRVNLETKNLYLEFMVPDTPVKATLGLQGITLHQGWFISNDVSAVRFDMNFDPVVLTAYWAGLQGLDGGDSVSSNDWWQVAVSGGYKAENMDARLSIGYERGPNDLTTADQPKDDDFYLVMGEFGMSFDLVSFNIIAGINFGEADGSGPSTANNRDYSGYLFQAQVDFALDLATLNLQFIYASGDKEGDFDDDFRGMGGMAVAWGPEIITNGYFYDRDAQLNQIGGTAYSAGDESPNNLWSVGVGADIKPADNTTIYLDLYYIAMVEDRTVAGSKEDTIGVEFDARLAQKIYDNLTFNVVGAYMFADDGFGVYNGTPTATNQASDSGDDAFQVGIGIDYSF